jgi:hypothetical protein
MRRGTESTEGVSAASTAAPSNCSPRARTAGKALMLANGFAVDLLAYPETSF